MEEDREDDLLASMPTLVRLAVSAYVRTLGWGVRQGVHTGNAALRLVLSADGADRLQHEIREQLRKLLGVTELEQRIAPTADTNGADPIAVLKERGAELLARSADVDGFQDAHPAYERILTSLAPDEARILRLIAIEGPRAAVDVRTWRPLDKNSEVIATGLTMIGAEAGCFHLDRVPAYLSNLFRLGLIWFSREAVEDGSAYQVLEAQPDVQEAMERAGRGKTVRRSVQMTPFGKDFCETCLPIDTAGFIAIQEDIRTQKR
jgi:hypothetical protein